MTIENTENETPKNNEEETSEEESNEGGEELVKAKEVAENQKIRAEKAEKELKALKAEKAKVEKAKSDTETSKNEEQPNATDYGKLAYLKAEGVDHADDRKIVTDEAARLKLPIEEVLGLEHIKGKLKTAKEQREAESGMPEGGSGKTSGNKGSVEYWVDKKDKDGNYLTPTDTELAGKVIDARLKSEEQKSEFEDVRL